MPQWFVTGLRRGVVTTRYPARREPAADDLPTPPAFRPEWLSQHRALRLAEVCPSSALAVADGELVFDVGKCTACGRCQQAVPEAVTASGEFELATGSRPDLVKRIPILPSSAP
jgi:hypothetical protein